MASLPALSPESRPHDLKMKATLTLEAGDGEKIVEIAIDQNIEEVFNPAFLGQAAATVRDLLHFQLAVPVRALVLAYIQGLKAARYPRGRRLDDPPDCADWQCFDQGRDLMNAAIDGALRDHDLDLAS